MVFSYAGILAESERYKNSAKAVILQ